VKKIILILFYLTFHCQLQGQMYSFFNIGELFFRPGIVLEKKVTDIYSFGAGVNLIGTHGLLKNDNINYYGIEIGFIQTETKIQKYQGVKFGLTYQIVRNYMGFNFNNSCQIFNGQSFWSPELGISFLGFISLNYGYYIPLNNEVNLNKKNLNITLKLSINLSYGESLNIVGKSDKRW